MAKRHYYVVWNGVTPGVYNTWEECEAQIKGVKQALYKSFGTLAEAERAYASSPYDYIGNKAKSEKKSTPATLPATVIKGALAVDAACSGNPGMMEYRGVYIATGEEVFHFGPMFGTNNIGEFLAIVHALALLKQKSPTMTIYSDSKIAQLWVMKRECKTKLERTPKTEKLLQDVDRAVAWLHNNTYQNKILKWKTEEWGEIPADFGRK